MEETINYIHQTSYIHSRFTKKFNKSLSKSSTSNSFINANCAEQILLDDQGALKWYD